MNIHERFALLGLILSLVGGTIWAVGLINWDAGLVFVLGGMFWSFEGLRRAYPEQYQCWLAGHRPEYNQEYADCERCGEKVRLWKP